MIFFWTFALGTALIIAAFLVLAAFRGRETGPAAAFDVQVYRDQLKELERDLARGVINAEEAERAKLEVSRRLLAADKALQVEQKTGQASARTSVVLSVVMAVIITGGGAAIYSRMGAPGYPDMGLKTRLAAAEEARTNRPGQAEAEAQVPPQPALETPDPQFLDLVEKLRAAVVDNPEDPRGFKLLARSEASLGNFVAAHKAKAREIELIGEENVDENDYPELADLLILAAGGYVSPEAEEVLLKALRIDRGNGTARYYMGLMFAQTGRPDLAFRIWSELLAQSRPQAPWVPAIRGQIEALARAAGVDYTLPPLPSAPAMPGLPGPDADAVAAAEDMTDEERAQMISGMVEQLAQRLATEGGSAAEWARLIRVLGVQGDTQRAAAIWGEAQEHFASSPDDLAQIRAAAVTAGVAE
ncbi:MAG: c-type cytochrome biogenesis protein CcmI [Brevirhabdus sp.]